jgi:hypothetical protein
MPGSRSRRFWGQLREIPKVLKISSLIDQVAANGSPTETGQLDERIAKH